MLALNPVVPFYLNAFTWNFGLGMTYLLIPLYAHELGMSGVAIGSLASVPVLIQVWLSLIGGAYADRIGAKRTSLFSSAFVVAASLVFVSSASFAGLLAGQFLMIIARAAFWPASWSLASELPGDRSQNMGRLNAVTNAGMIAGVAVAGMVIARFGFRIGFWLMVAMGAVSFLSSMFIVHRRQEPAVRPALFQSYAVLLRRRPIYFAMICAYLSALPYSLSASFLPILLVEQGFSSDGAGWLLALRAAGTIAAGVGLSGVVRGAGNRVPPFLSAMVSAATVGLIALFAHPLWAGVLLVVLGVASGILTVYFQIVISAISSPEQRGSAMALAGLGWSLSNLTVPVLVGTLADLFGVHAAFHVAGAVSLAFGLCLLPLHRWALREQAG